MRLVIVESPFTAKTQDLIDINVRYARACLHDCLMRGEAPFASHLLYTQPGVLNDRDAAERALGIAAGLSWGPHADATVVYYDFGISAGMRHGIARAHHEMRAVTYRMFADLGMTASGPRASELPNGLAPQCVPLAPTSPYEALLRVTGVLE